MTAELLALAVKALAPAGTSLGEVPSGSNPPWRSLSVSVPGSPERSDAATVQSLLVRVQATISTVTDQGTLRIADEMVQALEGARPIAVGWSCGPLLQVGMGSPYLADATSQTANKRLSVIHVSFAFTAVRLP